MISSATLGNVVPAGEALLFESFQIDADRYGKRNKLDSFLLTLRNSITDSLTRTTAVFT